MGQIICLTALILLSTFALFLYRRSRQVHTVHAPNLTEKQLEHMQFLVWNHPLYVIILSSSWLVFALDAPIDVLVLALTHHIRRPLFLFRRDPDDDLMLEVKLGPAFFSWRTKPKQQKFSETLAALFAGSD